MAVAVSAMTPKPAKVEIEKILEHAAEARAQAKTATAN